MTPKGDVKKYDPNARGLFRSGETKLGNVKKESEQDKKAAPILRK